MDAIEARPATRIAVSWALAAASLLGFALALSTLLGRGIAGDGGVGGTDALAYWLAGQRALAGQPLYGAGSGTNLAYLYPPVFAELIAPVTLLPAPTFVWLVRLVSIVCLRLTLGHWTRVGWALLLFPPVIIELDYGNLDLVIALACALTIRKNAALVPVTISAKLAGLPLVPIAIARDPRRLAIAGVACAVIVLLSVAWSPSQWTTYASFLSTMSMPDRWPNLAAGIPFPPRLGLAMLLGVAAIRVPRIASIAVVLALPAVWPGHLSILTALAASKGRRAAPAEQRRPEGVVE
jgi:hypothetical protein